MGKGEEAGQLPEFEVARRLFDGSPHGALIGLKLIDLGADFVVAGIDYRPELVGNPQTGYLHGGVITTLIDQSSGAAVMVATGACEPIVTLDLRIDHLRPALPEQPIYARAECYRTAREVAFARCVAYQDDPQHPFATSMSAFMRLRAEKGSGRGRG
ncbi:thioesterase [Halorhodospira abdelmalekii]|uniref:PaaI family thioesterase n=1 Tax=Halorhodospira abdelmalekii TaxID=421629 RepID=UPI001907FF25|nr:PaaI family thioesterase [Halorhodospira abdelmalekii]MBK1734765.1 thioesterase [Halorhodospira abdelmalekii]